MAYSPVHSGYPPMRAGWDDSPGDDEDDQDDDEYSDDEDPFNDLEVRYDDSDEDPDYNENTGSPSPTMTRDDEDERMEEDDGENEPDDDAEGLVGEEMAEFYSDLKAARGFKKGGRRKGARRAGDENLSFEVKRMMGEANQLFVYGDIDKAFVIVKNVIQIEANVYAAWKMLGEIFLERGEPRKALLAWLTAAHANRKDQDLWMMCARMSLEQYGPEQNNYRDQAIYCYSRAIAASSANIDAIYDRAALYRQMGQLNKAAEGFIQLSKLVPNDMGVLRDIATMYIELERVPEAIALYKSSVEHFKFTGNPNMAFGWSELNILIELHCLVKMWADAIHTLRNLARWLYGRSEETYWDQIGGDDREWDADDTRRNLVHDYDSGKFAPETYTLPVELRVKLGVCRLKLDNKDEAMAHFQYLVCVENPEEYIDLFQEAGDVLCGGNCFEEGLEFYSTVLQIAENLDRKFWLNLAACYKGLGRAEDAAECYGTLIDADGEDVEAMTLLAEIYERSNQRAEALELVNAVIRIRRAKETKEKAATGGSKQALTPAEQEAANALALVPNQPERRSTRRRAGQTLTPAERAEVEIKKTEQTRIRVKQLEYLKDGVETGDKTAVKQWLDTAGDLVDEFRNTKALYPTERKTQFVGFQRTARRRAAAEGHNVQVEKMQHRLQESLTFDDGEDQPAIDPASVFRGLDFDTWLYIFMQYAIYLTRYDNYQDAYDVCSVAKEANVFYHYKKRTFIIWSTWLSCAVYANDAESCSYICRYFMTNFQYQSEVYTLFTAAMTASRKGIEVFHNNANQKYLLRQIKLMDQHMSGEKRIGAALLSAENEDGTPYYPVQNDVPLLMLYGHILACGKSYISALNYYTRAYAVDPTHPHILFCIGLAYLHRSMQRQSDNRHLQVFQAMSFLFEYYDRRSGGVTVDDLPSGSDPLSEIDARKAEALQEVEYNLARAFHHTGLTHLAVPYYERVLAISTKCEARGLREDMKWEAAYNLQMISVTSGNVEMARCLTEQWLVV